MSNLKNFIKNNKIFIISLSAFSLLRIYLGLTLPIWLYTIGAELDDLLMLNYAHLNYHFSYWGIETLVKDISYPIFLFFVRISQLQYRFWISILWIIAATLVIYAIYNFITKNNKLLILSFIFILFLPPAFDISCGLRVYRNAILAPSTIIFLTSLFTFINQLLNFSQDRIKHVLWGVISGLTFTFNFYIKEDGIVTLPILLICILVILVFILYDNYKLSFRKENIIKITKISILALLPVIIFASCTLCYAELNNHYFCVSEINTRTGGELGEFYCNLLKIDDDNKTTEIWIPASTVEKAYNSSPTLQKHPKFIDEWLHRTWGGGILINSTIRGDHPSWSMRYALNNSGIYTNEKAVNELFYNVNNELNQAFDNGSLKKSDKIFITSSLPGKNIDEILEMTPYIHSAIRATIFYEGFNYNFTPIDGSSLTNTTDNKYIESDLNEHLITYDEMDNLPILDKISLDLIKLDGSIYHIISHIIILLVFISFIILCKNQIKNQLKDRTANTLFLFCIMIFGTMLVQIFSISWFCSWLTISAVKFYLAPCYGTYATFVVFTITGAYSKIEIKDHKENDS